MWIICYVIIDNSQAICGKHIWASTCENKCKNRDLQVLRRKGYDMFPVHIMGNMIIFLERGQGTIFLSNDEHERMKQLSEIISQFKTEKDKQKHLNKYWCPKKKNTKPKK